MPIVKGVQLHGLQRESTSVEHGSTENKKVLIRLSLPLVYLQIWHCDICKGKWTKRKLLTKCAIPRSYMDKREVDGGMAHSLG